MTTLLNRGYANLFLKVRSFDIFQRKHLFILPWSNDIFHKGNCKVRWQKIRTWMSQKKFIQLYNIWGTRLSAEVKSWKQSPSRLNHYQVHWAEKTSNVETVVVVLFHPSVFFFFFQMQILYNGHKVWVFLLKLTNFSLLYKTWHKQLFAGYRRDAILPHSLAMGFTFRHINLQSS